LRQAGLEAQAALELRLGRLQVPALKLVQARVVMVERPPFALLPPVEPPPGDKEQPGRHQQQPCPGPPPLATTRCVRTQPASGRRSRQRQAKQAQRAHEDDGCQWRHKKDLAPQECAPTLYLRTVR